jgi:hypothetical protein
MQQKYQWRQSQEYGMDWGWKGMEGGAAGLQYKFVFILLSSVRPGCHNRKHPRVLPPIMLENVAFDVRRMRCGRLGNHGCTHHGTSSTLVGRLPALGAPGDSRCCCCCCDYKAAIAVAASAVADCRCRGLPLPLVLPLLRTMEDIISCLSPHGGPRDCRSARR